MSPLSRGKPHACASADPDLYIRKEGTTILQAVIFDMYETLITIFDQRPYYSAEMAKDAGVPKEDFRRFWHVYEERRTLGACDLSGSLRGTLAALGIHDEALLRRMLHKRLTDQQRIFASVRKEIVDMLMTLKDRGCRLGLISNCYLEERDCIRASVLAPCFDSMMLSCEQGVRKPDPEIYRRCLSGLNVRAEDALYVGDGGSLELEQAALCGLKTAQACWFIHEDEPDQPCCRKAGFLHAESPADIIVLAEQLSAPDGRDI